MERCTDVLDTDQDGSSVSMKWGPILCYQKVALTRCTGGRPAQACDKLINNLFTRLFQGCTVNMLVTSL